MYGANNFVILYFPLTLRRLEFEFLQKKKKKFARHNNSKSEKRGREHRAQTRMATTTPDTDAIKGKVVRKPPRFKRRIEEADIVGPRGVPKILKDLSSAKFSADNKVYLIMSPFYVEYNTQSINIYYICHT
jgi:hypothetical protein